MVRSQANVQKDHPGSVTKYKAKTLKMANKENQSMLKNVRNDFRRN